MGKIILISFFMFFVGCTGFKSLPNQDETRFSKKAIKFVKAAVYFCGEMVEEAQREKPNYKLIENKLKGFNSNSVRALNKTIIKHNNKFSAVKCRTINNNLYLYQ